MGYCLGKIKCLLVSNAFTAFISGATYTCHVGVRGQLAGVNSLLLTGRSWESNSRNQAWRQMPFWPTYLFVCFCLFVYRCGLPPWPTCPASASQGLVSQVCVTTPSLGKDQIRPRSQTWSKSSKFARSVLGPRLVQLQVLT